MNGHELWQSNLKSQRFRTLLESTSTGWSRVTTTGHEGDLQFLWSLGQEHPVANVFFTWTITSHEFVPKAQQQKWAGLDGHHSQNRPWKSCPPLGKTGHDASWMLHGSAWCQVEKSRAHLSCGLRMSHCYALVDDKHACLLNVSETSKNGHINIHKLCLGVLHIHQLFFGFLSTPMSIISLCVY